MPHPRPHPRPRGLVPTVLVAGLLATSSVVATGLPASAAVPAPAVHYTFGDDLTTGRIADSSGNGADATLVNGSTASLVDGIDGTALKLPGGASNSAAAYVRLPATPVIGSTDLTISARVRWDGGTAPWQWIYTLGTNTSRYVFATPSNGDGNFRAAVTTNGGGAAEAQVTGLAALPKDTWKTVTVVLDDQADRITAYLDGAAVASASTTVSGGQLVDATATTGGYIGKSFYPDPFFAGAVDDFKIFRSALSGPQVAELVGDGAARLTTVKTTSFDVRTFVGTAPALPASAPGSFTDGYDRNVPITWDAVPADRYASPGTFTVAGTADTFPVTATVTVIRAGEMHIDLGKRTGAFHGGASGTLYGLYGEGVPTRNLIEGMGLRTVSTKAQDGPQHPGADALEVVKPLADSTGGDVYIYMTDIYRGFPYQWEGSTPEEKLSGFLTKMSKQVDQVLTLDPKYQQHVVFVPFNEPEGNMFGTGDWSYNRVSWLNDPKYYFSAWDRAYALIKGKMPSARIAGPNTSVLYTQVKGFLQHAVQAGTVPDVMTWHELSHPEQIRTSVARYRVWEKEVFAGTAFDGRQLPININEYAFNYHTSVPGQMVQWMSAIEDSKVDADIAYWNIDGNLSDSAVQANRGNGQWWLYNAYAGMTGDTVAVAPPMPGQNYTLKGLATIDDSKRQSRAIFGGADGPAYIQFDHVPAAFGTSVHAWIREIPWTGQIGDSAQPQAVAELDTTVQNGTVAFDFNGGALPTLKESSAYEIVLSPSGVANPTSVKPFLWQQDYEAENATYTGSGYSRNGPEGSPKDVSKFYTSGMYDVGGLRTGSDGVLSFTVDVPKDGRYDLGVFANSFNTYDKVQEQGPTNVFLRVDGAAEQELFLPLGYKWVVWDHTDTTVQLSAGRHVIALAATSLDGSKATKGDAIVDRIHLALPNPAASAAIYEAETASLVGAQAIYSGLPGTPASISGAGAVQLAKGGSATFWVYSRDDAEATLDIGMVGPGDAAVSVNGQKVMVATAAARKVAVSLSGGVNKVTVTGLSRSSVLDRLVVSGSSGRLAPSTYQAEDAQRTGSASLAALSLANGGKAVDGIGGTPGNDNALTFRVQVPVAGTYAVRVRYSNPEQSPATHYNPDPLARRADISVNGGAAQSTLFPHTFHQNNFWVLTIPMKLAAGENTIRFSSQEQPNFDGRSYASQTFPGEPLRSRYAPLIDQLTVSSFATPLPQS
ncbi:Ig-like domain-containing protein [Terrabacter sp. MAHUQ-38]|nr:Ig-like domain-containing protein [Terrabacter sp. MAHUQ-38]